MSILQVKDITAGYATGDQILKGVDFHVHEGEIVCIIGPNGAGKSTLLKTVAGLLKPSRGEIRLRDQAINGLKPKDVARAGVAFVPQENNVFPNMTVYENLEMGGYIDPTHVNVRAEAVLKRFKVLAVKRRQLARTLSGGQRQLLAVGMALMVQPSVLLLDEPTAGLSPAAAQQLLDEIGLISQSGIAVALVEQNAHDAMAISDRTYILVDGRNSRTGASGELLRDKDIRRMFLGG
jgi:ABC-type branched-subunit amino acid transport system ATPase component